MNVLVTGPESSGTRYVTDILTEAGLDAEHRSMPEGDEWWDPTADHWTSWSTGPAFACSFDAIVLVIRGRHAHLSSLVLRGICSTWDEASARRRSALRALAPIIAEPSTLLVTYESLANVGEVRSLLCELGVDAQRFVPPKFSSENDKHYWPSTGYHRGALA